MKKILFIIVFGFIAFNFANAQVICIYCYDQNAPISSPINDLLYNSNGGFELGCQIDSHFCPASANFSCFLSSWACTGGGPLTYARVVDNYWSVIPEGFVAAYFGNFMATACSPAPFDTSCLIMDDCEVTGIPAGYPENSNAGYGGDTGVSLATSVSGLTPGNAYVLEFWTGGESDVGNFTEPGLFAVDLGFGNIFLRNNVTAPPAGIGKRYIIVFNAINPWLSIKFTNWGHVCQTCTELVLDDVRLYTYAELSPSVPSCFNGTGPDIERATADISPNPFTNELTVKTNDLSEIILYDIASGKLLYQEFTGTVSLNTDKLAKGIYFYEVRNKHGVVKTGKVVKE